MLTVTARVSNGSSRYAMPSMPALVYAALLYKDGNSIENPASTNFVQGTEATDGKLNFSFQKPDDTSEKFTLEIFAFRTDTSAADFSRENALLSGIKDKCTIKDDTINVDEPIALAISSSKPGTVSLKINVPEECSLTVDDTARFIVTGTSPDFIITQAGDGISAGAYQLKFTVKKGEEKEEIVHIFSEYINVINGFCTDTWSGSEKGAAKDVANSIAKTVYVRGAGGWYDTNSPYDDGETATASDTNSGSFLSPLATIQKAVDTVIARNDGTSEYTIYVDGKFTAASSAALADFSDVSKHLSVKIAGLDPSSLDESTKAVIDGNNSARGIVVGSSSAQKDVNLALENLVIQNTKNSDRGGGITLYCTAGNSHTIKNCVIKNNHAGYGSAIYNEYGLLDLQGCVISGNTTDTSGTVYIGRESAILTMSDVSIENNSAKNGGGLFLAYDATAKISDVSVVIRNNSIGSSSRGVGICLWNGRLELSGSAKIDDVVGFPNERDSITHEVVVAGDLTAASPVATITPSSYSAGEKVLSANDATTIQNICDKFAITPQDDGTGWKIAPDGANGVLAEIDTIYLDYYGSNANLGLTASGAVNRLSKAIELYDAYNAQKIMVCANYELRSDESTLLDRAGKRNLTLVRYDGSSDVPSSFTGTLLSISQGDVAITNVTLDGSKEKVTAGGALLYIGGSSTIVTLGDGAILCNNKKKGNGSGVYIDSGTFRMTGGTVTENDTVSDRGAGVYLGRGRFEMSGGKIIGNTVTTSHYEGGGVYINDGTFEMSGGEISGNEAYRGGGVYINGSCTFNMTDGKITGNIATNLGGGDFTMEGGEITGNNAPSSNGVYIDTEEGATFTNTGGTVQAD